MVLTAAFFTGAAFFLATTLTGFFAAGFLVTGLGDLLATGFGAFLAATFLTTFLATGLAAGLALPLLAAFGYAPGIRTPEGLQALTWAYCLVPCALKLLAAALLYFLLLRKSP